MLFGASCPPMGDPQSLMGSVQGTQSSFGFDIEMEQCSDDGLFSVINTNNALFAKRSFPAPSAPPMAFCCGTTAQPLSGGPLFGAPESEQLQESTALLKLVKMQHFIGSWSLDKDLCECTGLSPEAVRVAKPIKWSASTDLDLSEAVWATVVALAYLEIKESENKDEWMLIARKARQWIQNEAKLVLKDSTVVTNTFNELMQKAKKLFTDSQSFH
ncbi:unnamed protein product [Dicrocoelium dendriticum]|nr:unnamed protein product [Dicrocoelium dendriticum]